MLRKLGGSKELLDTNALSNWLPGSKRIDLTLQKHRTDVTPCARDASKARYTQASNIVVSFGDDRCRT